MSKSRTVALVGPLDTPVGDMSGHVRALAEHLDDSGFRLCVIDAFPDPGKAVDPEFQHLISPVSNRLLATLWAARRARAARVETLHLHGARLDWLTLLLAGLTLWAEKRVVLTVHDGLDAAESFPAGLRFAARHVLRRLDRVVALSDAQGTFYVGVGVRAARIVIWSPDQIERIYRWGS